MCADFSQGNSVLFFGFFLSNVCLECECSFQFVANEKKKTQYYSNMNMKYHRNSNLKLIVVRTNLGADEQVRDTGCILLQLRHPFLTHILETGRVYHREADEEDVGHWVGQRPETVIVLLEECNIVRINTDI